MLVNLFIVTSIVMCSDEQEREYNVEIYGMNDNESNVSETVLQYDSLKFDNKQISGPEATNDQQGSADLSNVVYQAVDNCFEDEYTHLKHN